MKQFQPLELSFWSHIARILRHGFTLAWRAQSLLSASEREEIASAIEESEKHHTGEIAVAIESRLPWVYLKRRARARERAWNAFGKLQVWDTPQNNGVLIYLLYADKRIEIVADRALAEVIPQEQWDAWVHTLYEGAANQTWCAGILTVIQQLDVHMRAHFPQTAVHSDENRTQNQPAKL